MAALTWAARVAGVRAVTTSRITAYCSVRPSPENAAAARGLAASATARSGGTVASRCEA